MCCTNAQQAAKEGEGVAGVISRSVEEGLALAHAATTGAAEASAELQAQARRLAVERERVENMSLAARVELGRVRELVGASSLPFGAALQVCAIYKCLLYRLPPTMSGTCVHLLINR